MKRTAKRLLEKRGGDMSAGLKTKKRRGSVIVEFAAIAPFLILISLMLVQFALFANANISLSQIAREGARTAAVGGRTNTQIQSIINTTATNTGINPSHITTTITPSNQSDRVPGTTVTVRIAYNMNNRRILPSQIFGVTIVPNTVTRTANMMVEGPVT
jgi:Flp pilus assembly protein TadG